MFQKFFLLVIAHEFFLPYKNIFTANCIKNKGRFYQGQQNITHGGLECQEWFTSEPHTQTMPKGIFPEMNLAKNFCRNPGGTEPSPWCYTKDPLIRWQHCQIDKCGEFIIQTYIEIDF